MWTILKRIPTRSTNSALKLTTRALPSEAVTGRSFDVGEKIHGYVVKRVEPVNELCLTAIELEHEGSGAQHLHLSRDDSNNCFSVTLRTTPTDSTGVAHILEHLALCGSSKYPCRDPFMKMTTRSLATFMNAMTWPDATMYPFSSQNLTDFHNLMNVYLDAVFFPHLKYMDFRQEGWRLEHKDINDKSSEILFKGVVFNEMKGAFSSSSQTYFRHLLNNLYPDLTYGHESGGDPLEIPNLSYENLRSFYSRHYHPSNSKFLTYGNFPLESHLELINDQVLSKFKKNSAYRKESEVPLQPTWTEPRSASKTCAPDSMAPFPDRQTTFSISYKLKSVEDYYENFVLGILAFLLADGPNSPFYEALIASGLGMDFSPGQGFSNFTKESFFSIGLMGMKNEQVDEVREVIEKTFNKAAQEGFPQERLEAVLHQLEIGLKHQTTSFGLHLAMNLLPRLNHDSDAVTSLHLSENIEKLRNNLKKDGNYLQNKVKEYFIDNPHRLLLTMNPSQTFLDDLKKEEAELLKTRTSQLDEQGRLKIYEEGLKLSEEQKMEDDASVLPILNIEKDISRELQKPILHFNTILNTHVQTSPQDTNGVNYFKALYRIDEIGRELRPFFPLFSSCLTRIGAGNMNHKQVDQEIMLKTKGLRSSIHISEEINSMTKFETGLLLSSFCLERNFESMLNLWTEIINRPQFGQDKEHLKQLIQMSASDLSDSISGAGNRFASTRAASSISPAANLKEEIGGLSYASFLKSISEANDADLVIENFEKIHKLIKNTGVLRVALNAQEPTLNSSMKHLEQFIANAKAGGQGEPKSLEGFKPSNLKEHHILNFNTNYVGAALPSVPFGHEDYAALRIAARLVSAKFLLREVREIGGAYGATAGITDGGIFTFSSYRDPKTLQTLEKFNEATQWLAKGDFKEDQVQESILATFQAVDAPVSNESKGNLCFLGRMTYEQRHEYRLRLLNVKREDIIRVAKKYLVDRKDTSAVVIGPENEEIASTSGWNQVKK